MLLSHTPLDMLMLPLMGHLSGLGSTHFHMGLLLSLQAVRPSLLPSHPGPHRYWVQPMVGFVARKWAGGMATHIDPDIESPSFQPKYK